jgi:serine protease inhibitor
MGELSDKIQQVVALTETYISDVQVYNDQLSEQLSLAKDQAAAAADTYSQQIKARTEQYVADLKAIQETEPVEPV